MIMIRSIVRPEKVDNVLAALMEAGFPGVTKMSVVGRGKQRGIKIGEVTYDEIPKEMLLTVVKDGDKEFVVKTIIKAARTGEKGAFGDGKSLSCRWRRPTPSARVSGKPQTAGPKRCCYERADRHRAHEHDEPAPKRPWPMPVWGPSRPATPWAAARALSIFSCSRAPSAATRRPLPSWARANA